MTIKELFGHAIGVAKFPDFAKFYNWLTRNNHEFKGDVTFKGSVDFTDATATGVPDSRPYKVHTSRVSISGTSVSSTYIFENTLGYDLIISGFSGGRLTFLAPAPFAETEDKLHISVSGNVYVSPNTFVLTSYNRSYGGPPFKTDRIFVGIHTANFTSGTLSAATSGSVDVEIRVYD